MHNFTNIKKTQPPYISLVCTWVVQLRVGGVRDKVAAIPLEGKLKNVIKNIKVNSEYIISCVIVERF